MAGKVALYVLNDRLDAAFAFWIASPAKAHSEPHQLLKSLKFLSARTAAAIFEKDKLKGTESEQKSTPQLSI